MSVLQEIPCSKEDSIINKIIDNNNVLSTKNKQFTLCIPGNKRVDELAKAGGNFVQPCSPQSYNEAKTLKKTICADELMRRK